MWMKSLLNIGGAKKGAKVTGDKFCGQKCPRAARQQIQISTVFVLGSAK